MQNTVIGKYDSYRAYLRDIRNIPLARNDEQRTLAMAIRQGNLQARERFISGNLRMVIDIAKRYRNNGLPFADLIQEGNVGLIHAADRFDPSFGCRFSTYGTRWVRHMISRALSSKTDVVRMSLRNNALSRKIKKASEMLQQKLGRAPTEAEIAGRLRVPVKKVKSLLPAVARPVDSLNFDADLSAQHLFEASPAVYLDNTAMEHLLKEDMEQLLSEIPDMEERVLRLRFGIDNANPLTLRETGKILKLSRQTVKHIEDRALTRLRKQEATSC